MEPLHAQNWKPELFEVVGKEIYTWHPAGQGRSLLGAALGKLPWRVAVTTRNWNTMQRLVECSMADEQPMLTSQAVQREFQPVGKAGRR